jgi:CubicO group peptidase (beta-lactamase class C family)
MRIVHFAGLLLATMWLKQAAAADRFDDIREYIRGELIATSTPSVAVAVAQDGKIILEQGFGWADRERRIVATEHTVYSIASISKPLTATGLMVLAQSGRLDLGRPANDYLGNAKLRARVGNASDATVRLVANHTSGLPRHLNFFFADEPFHPPSMDETILRYGSLFAAPGERYKYSNLGYGVLSYIIERVSGVSYEQFMRQNVFAPLGMTRTSVGLAPELEPYAATRYGEDGLPVPFYDFDHRGAAAIFASAHDLVRFGVFHLKAHLPDQKDILSDATIDEMHRPTASAGKLDYGDTGYGIGFMTSVNGGHKVVSHDGGMEGVSTQMLLIPDRKLAIVVLSNSSSAAAFAVADRIAEKLLPGWRKAALEEEPVKSPFVTPSELSGVWKGSLSTYTKDIPVELEFLPNGDVHAKLGDQLTTLVNGAQFQDGLFTGEFMARIGTPDTERGNYTISLSLKLRGNALNGAAHALCFAPRMHFALAHWIELRRETS